MAFFFSYMCLFPGIWRQNYVGVREGQPHNFQGQMQWENVGPFIL